MPGTVPWNLLGFSVSGDVGGYTIYTDKNNRKIAFPLAPPDKPPSPAQAAHRERFRLAQAAWSGLSDQVKLQLETASQAGSLVMTGQNLYITIALQNDNTALQTLAEQTGTTLPFIPFVL